MNLHLHDFTKKNLYLFNNNKYNLDDNNILLLNIKKERNNIKSFIESNNNLKYYVKNVNNQFDENFIKYSYVNWVMTRNVINLLNESYKTIEIIWNNNSIKVKGSYNKINNFLKRVNILIYMLEYLKNKTNGKSINIYIFLSPLIKESPLENDIIDVPHVNTGYTDTSENIIFIWRYEEFEKVIFHEMIHYFDIDMREQHVPKLINVSHKHTHSYWEAWTDFLGIFYHIIYVSLISHIKLKQILEYELTFIRNQSTQLIKHLNIKNIKTDLIKQNTPAFSYYILKYLLFEYFLTHDIPKHINYNKLLNTCIDNIEYPIFQSININSFRMTLFQLN